MSVSQIAFPSTRCPAPKAQPASPPVKVLIKAIARAIKKAKHGVRVDQEVDEASSLLASMPMTTDVFGYASNRLRNANRYVHSGEFGAASWELAALWKLVSRLD